jgi:pimeloyl-ACP methyl ester carboxylesterase
LYQWLFSEPFFMDEAVVAAAAEGSTNYAHRQSPGDFARQVAALDRLGPIDVAAIRCPVLAIAGELDLLAAPKAVMATHAAIPDVRHVVIVGAAHSIHWEKPAETARAILDFLR